MSVPFLCLVITFFFFFFNDTATTEIYTLSLHDALPIYSWLERLSVEQEVGGSSPPNCTNTSTLFSCANPRLIVNALVTRRTVFLCRLKRCCKAGLVRSRPE